MNLYQKLLAITEEVGKIEKTGRNTSQGYAFIEQAKVVAELRPQLAKHGVMIMPETIDRTINQFTNKNGNVTFHAVVVSRYTVINADNPEERMVLDWHAGEALDMSDKATNKATTASQKTFLMKLFNISDQDDADKESPEVTGSAPAATKVATPKPSAGNPVSANQAKLLKDLIENVPAAERAEFLMKTISKPKPETSAEASTLIQALFTYKQNAGTTNE